MIASKEAVNRTAETRVPCSSYLIATIHYGAIIAPEQWAQLL